MKNFEEIYKKVCEDCNEISSETQKNITSYKGFKIYAIIGIILLILVILTPGVFMTVIIFYLLFYLSSGLLIYSLYKYSYKNKTFKNNVMTSLVKNYDSALKFSISGSIPPFVYKQAEFENYDEYHSEDSISGKIDNKISFNMSNILTQDVSTDSDGDTTYTTLFSGLFAHILLPKNLNLRLLVHNDESSGFLGKLFSPKDRLEMDSQEFEKYFDVMTSDKIKAMQLLTSDVMSILLDFRTKNKNKLELTIKDNNLYIRFHCGNVFERKSFKDALDHDTLKQYFDYIDFACEVSKVLYNIVDESYI